MDPETPFEAAPQLLEHDDYHVGGVKPTSQPSDEPELAGREDEVPADPDILRRPCRTTKRGIRVTMTDEDRRFIRAAETDNFAFNSYLTLKHQVVPLLIDMTFIISRYNWRSAHTWGVTAGHQMGLSARFYSIFNTGVN